MQKVEKKEKVETKAAPAKKVAPVAKAEPAKKATPATQTASVAKTTPAPKKTTAKKKTTKKAATKKTTVKKAEKAENVYVQFSGREFAAKDVLANVKAAFVADGHRESSIKDLKLYIKPEEVAAYYVINDKYTGKVSL